MFVTKIEPVGKTKYKIYIEEQFAFELYKGELSRYHIAEDAPIEAEVVENIKKNVILKRIKLRSMHLLNDMDRTESGLRTKLKQGGYTEEMIEQALDYMKSFGYINDDNYARRFIESRKGNKSKKEVYALLCKKGMAKEQIELAMETIYGEADEIEAIQVILRKKRFHQETADNAEIQKICGYLMRKGFRYNDIRQVIQVSDRNA